MHDGRLTNGRKGAVKSKEVIDYIRTEGPSMITSDGKIVLGTFDCSKEILWSQDNTKEFIKNIINYSMLRDKFRKTR